MKDISRKTWKEKWDDAWPACVVYLGCLAITVIITGVLGILRGTG